MGSNQIVTDSQKQDIGLKLELRENMEMLHRITTEY